MPGLSIEDEKSILDGLFALQNEFEGVLALSTGRLMKEVDGCTHGIFVRFPSEETLVNYYNSPPLKNIAMKMRPFLCGEYTVDYLAYVENVESWTHGCQEFDFGVEHFGFLKVKEGVDQEVIKEMLASVYKLADHIGSVAVQISAGPNNYIRSNKFSHAFRVFIHSEKQLQEFCDSPVYINLWKEKIEPITSWSISSMYVPYQLSASSSEFPKVN